MPPKPPDDTVVNVAFRFPADLHAQAKQRAIDRDLSLSQYVRRLIRDDLRDAEPAQQAS